MKEDPYIIDENLSIQIYSSPNLNVNYSRPNST
jgi:hypothetical protein